MATSSVLQSTGLHIQSLPTVMHQSSPFPVERNRATAPKIAQDRLSSWKEVATYLRQGVRTVQRYETKCQLPVHRMNNTPRSPVFAFRSEIDFWLRSRRNDGNPVRSSREERCVSASLVNTSAELMIRCRTLQGALRGQMEILKEHMQRLQALRSSSGSSRVHLLAILSAPEVVRRNC